MCLICEKSRRNRNTYASVNAPVIKYSEEDSSSMNRLFYDYGFLIRLEKWQISEIKRKV